jgi:hypothetical protein
MFRLAPKTKDGYLNTMILTARAIPAGLTEGYLKLFGAALLLRLLNSGRRV